MAFDLLVKNGLLIDGTGAPARHADVAIAAGKIVDIGRFTVALRVLVPGLAGRRVQLVFELRNARLYGFQLGG